MFNAIAEYLMSLDGLPPYELFSNYMIVGNSHIRVDREIIEIWNGGMVFNNVIECLGAQIVRISLADPNMLDKLINTLKLP